MGFPVKISRTRQCQILLLLCVSATVLGLGMSGTGIYLSFHLGQHLKSRVAETQATDEAMQVYTRFFQPSNASPRVPLDLVTSNMGYTLVSLGLVVFVVNALGVLSSDMRLRPVILLFMILTVMTMLTEVVCFVTVVHEGSPLSRQGYEAARTSLLHTASRRGKENKASKWLVSFYLLMLAMECCGVRGPEDFEELYTDKYVPEVCCTRLAVTEALSRVSSHPCDTIHAAPSTAGGEDGLPLQVSDFDSDTDDLTSNATATATTTTSNGNDNRARDCAKHQAAPLDLSRCTQTKPHTGLSYKYHKQQGCYDALFAAIQGSFYWLIPTFLALLLLQIMQVVLSVSLMSKRMVQKPKLLDSNPL